MFNGSEVAMFFFHTILSVPFTPYTTNTMGSLYVGGIYIWDMFKAGFKCWHIHFNLYCFVVMLVIPRLRNYAVECLIDFVLYLMIIPMH